MSPNQQPVIQPDMYHPPDGTHPKVRQQQQHQPKMLMLMMIMAKTNTTTMSYMLIIFSVYEKRKMTNKRMNIKLHNYEEIERENICVNKPLRQSKKNAFYSLFCTGCHPHTKNIQESSNSNSKKSNTMSNYYISLLPLIIIITIITIININNNENDTNNIYILFIYSSTM
mmetsp:Transcript_14530/g.15704  ORF Transcript_14530/g.15704 Transcript_14530/m.15704 type:complete len:170 (-) Transcript_14530:32-541(-)